MLMDTSFKIIMVNDAYMALTGLAKDRLIGTSARDFRIIEQTGEGLKKVLNEKKRSVGEIKIEGNKAFTTFGIQSMIKFKKGDIYSTHRSAYSLAVWYSDYGR